MSITAVHTDRSIPSNAIKNNFIHVWGIYHDNWNCHRLSILVCARLSWCAVLSCDARTRSVISFIVHNCVVDDKSNSTSSLSSLCLLEKATFTTLHQSYFAGNILIWHSAAVRWRQVHNFNIMERRNSLRWPKDAVRNCNINASLRPQNNIVVCITRAFCQVFGCGRSGGYCG